MKKLFYITRSNMSLSPYQEAALPALARAGWELVVIGVNATRSVYRQHLPYPCTVMDLPAPHKTAAHEWAIFRHLQQARLGKYDVIYLNSQSLTGRAAFALTGPKFGKHIVYHNPDYYCPIDHPWHARMERRICRMSDLYINNEFHRGYITATLYRCTCPIITAPPNLPKNWPVPAPDPEKRAWMSGGDPNAFVLMLHGGYAQIRMTPQLVEALSLLPERFRLVLTGKGKAPDHVDERLAQLMLTNRVLRLPPVDFNDMLSYTVNADAGVLLYENNDLGNFFTAPGRMTEYLCCGLPLLGANRTGLENLILRYQLGITAEPSNPRLLADAILELDRRKTQGAYPAPRMRKLFEDHFAFDHWEPVVVDAFDKMLAGAPRRKKSSPPYPWMPSP